MEFFRIVDVSTTETGIRNSINLDHLGSLSSMLFPLGSVNGRRLPIGGLWGEFNLTFDHIRGGVRFALEECPNALAWTVTTGYPPAPDSIVIHLTINRKENAGDLAAEIADFLDDHSEYLGNIEY